MAARTQSEIDLPSLDDSGNGTPIIFIHGYPFDRSMWSEQIDSLKLQGYRAIAPDLRGFGGNVAQTSVCHSPAQEHRLKSVPLSSMEDMATDVAALMDRLGIDRAVVCGSSMGGYVALDFARLFPNKTLGLVLAGTRAPADNEKEKAAREQQIQVMLNEGMTPIADATLPTLLAPRTVAEKPEVVARVREMIMHANPLGAAAAQRGMATRRDYSEDLSGINVPALIIVGREDPIRPVADSEFMQEMIPDSRLEIIEDAAHMTNMEQPDIFNDRLLSFLRVV